MSEGPIKISKEMLGGIPEVQPEEAPYMIYDLGNLAAYADLDVDWKAAKSEEYIKATATECAQHFINALFTLPSEPAPEETGRLVTLPPPTTNLPRALPAPVDKPMTKWELFAKQKGIKKRKRQDKIWDEDSGTWGHRWGKLRANDESKAWVVDHKDSDDLAVDPWTRMEKDKKARVAKNKKQQLANIRRAQSGSRANVPGALDLSSVVGKEHAGKRNRQHKDAKSRGHLDIALEVAQTSTNSMGKFDEKRKGEGKIKQRKAPSNVASLQNIANDKAQSSNIMRKVLGKIKEKDALVMDKAMHSVKAMDMKSGELQTAKGLEAKKRLRAKMAAAKTNKGKGGSKDGKKRQKK